MPWCSLAKEEKERREVEDGTSEGKDHSGYLLAEGEPQEG